MPPLKNIKHELFAKALIETKGNQTKAYEAVYPVKAPVSVVNGSRMLTYADVKQRVTELMQNHKGTSPDHVVEKLAQGIDSDNEGIMMDGVKTALKVYGCFDEAKQEVNIGSINVTFGDAKPVNNPIAET